MSNDRFRQIPGKFRSRPSNRVGKIHTGLPRPDGGGFGQEVPYFVLDFDAVDAEGNPDPYARAAAKKVARTFGIKPTYLEAVFLSDDEEDVAPYEYKKYIPTSRKPVCRGDGQFCMRKVGGEMEKLRCPEPKACDFAKDEEGRTVCRMVTCFTIMLPSVSRSHTFQIDTSSYYAQANFQDFVELTRSLMGSQRFSRLPVVITRERRVSELPQGGTVVHYPLKFDLPEGDQFKRQLGAILAVRNMVYQAEARVQVPSVVTGYEGLSPDDSRPDRLFPTHLVEGVDPPSRENGVDLGADVGPCRGCGTMTDLNEIDAKTQVATGACAPCHNKEMDDRLDREAEKTGRGDGSGPSGHAACPEGSGATPPAPPSPSPALAPAASPSPAPVPKKRGRKSKAAPPPADPVGGSAPAGVGPEAGAGDAPTPPAPQGGVPPADGPLPPASNGPPPEPPVTKAWSSNDGDLS